MHLFEKKNVRIQMRNVCMHETLFCYYIEIDFQIDSIWKCQNGTWTSILIAQSNSSMLFDNKCVCCLYVVHRAHLHPLKVSVAWVHRSTCSKIFQIYHRYANWLWYLFCSLYKPNFNAQHNNKCRQRKGKKTRTDGILSKSRILKCRTPCCFNRRIYQLYSVISL